jgi:RecA-family ATPase
MASELWTLYSDVTVEPIKWLWHPYIAIGKITLLQGDPGDGKSSMMIHLIAELSKGGALPDGRAIGQPQKVIYQCAEDGAKDTIRLRMEAAGADCRNIAFLNESIHEGLTLDDGRIRGFISGFRPQLVVIDPIQSYVENDSDLQIAVKARKLMRRLSIWADTYNCAFVLIGHLNKQGRSKGLYRGLGSIDYVASARSVLQVERSEKDEDVRIVRHIKNNLDSLGDDFKFEIRKRTGFRWLIDQNEDEEVQISKAMEREPIIDQLPKNKHELAAMLIKRALADGPVESTEIRKLMAEYRIGEKTMNDVKTLIGIKPYRKMRSWYWAMPEEVKNTPKE